LTVEIFDEWILIVDRHTLDSLRADSHPRNSCQALTDTTTALQEAPNHVLSGTLRERSLIRKAYDKPSVDESRSEESLVNPKNMKHEEAVTRREKKRHTCSMTHHEASFELNERTRVESIENSRWLLACCRGHIEAWVGSTRVH